MNNFFRDESTMEELGVPMNVNFTSTSNSVYWEFRSSGDRRVTLVPLEYYFY